MKKQCWIWKIERVDGRIFCFTDHDENIKIGEENYLANGAFQPSRIESELGLEIPNMEILGGVDGEDICLDDLNRGLFLDAKVTQSVFDFHTHQVLEEAFYGEIARIEYSDGRFEAELRAPLQALNQVFGRSYVKNCQAKFCDEQCGLDAKNYTFEMTVEKFEGNILWLAGEEIQYPLSDALLRRADAPEHTPAISIKNAYETSGLLRVEIHKIRDADFSMGDKVRIIAGCDHSLNSCAEIYHNVKNFRGFPHMPSEEILNVRAERNIAKN